VVAVGRSPEELPYSDELTRSGATIMYTRAASHTRQPGPPTAEELRPLLAGSEVAYVCGSSRFAEFAEALLIGCGFSPEAIRVEQFGATH
jgi:ferredoxin-NADP reductase